MKCEWGKCNDEIVCLRRGRCKNSSHSFGWKLAMTAIGSVMFVGGCLVLLPIFVADWVKGRA